MGLLGGYTTFSTWMVEAQRLGEDGDWPLLWLYLFGSMLAGGCAVGAGVTGGSIFALTAWITLLGMWVGAGLTDRWIDGPAASQPAAQMSPALAP